MTRAHEGLDPRVQERLAALRAQLDSEVPRRTLEHTLVLATWNIREFDSPAYGQWTLAGLPELGV